MNIVVSQQEKKLNIEFRDSKLVDKYEIDKADEFLASLDRFIKKRKIDTTILEKADLKFVKVSILTERIIRAIIGGLRF